MLDRETWRFINTFAPWLSAIGTLSAVGVSLWLARRSYTITLRAHVSTYLALFPGQVPKDAVRQIGVSATNAGMREPIIKGLLWIYRPPFRKPQRFVALHSSNPASTTLPVKLAYGEQVSVWYTLSELEPVARPFIDVLRKSWVPRLAVRYFSTGFYTTTGEEVVAPIDKGTRAVLLDLLKKDKSEGT